MSFRGRYPSKFRRTGNVRGHERHSFKERGNSFRGTGRPFNKKYHEDRGLSPARSFEKHLSNKRRPVESDRSQEYHSERGRGRPLNKNFPSPNMRSLRSRGRYFRGRAGNYRGVRGKRFDSPRKLDCGQFSDRSPTDEWIEENEFIEFEGSFERSGSPNELYEGDELLHSGEEHSSFDRGHRSPLTIHRRFGSEEFREIHDRSPERRSRSHSRQPQNLNRDFLEEREHSFKRFKHVRSSRSRERREGSYEFERHLSIERRNNLNDNRRSRSIERRSRFKETRRSLSPVERLRRRNRERSLGNLRKSFDRSRSPRPFRSSVRSFKGSDRERSPVETSRRSLERQIAFEKQRLQEMLAHEKRFREKRSESSIERFLDDCKKSFDNKLKSPPISRSSSFGKRDSRHRSLRRSLERSLSPPKRPRRFKGLDQITIERGRSLERRDSPVVRSRSSECRDESFRNQKSLDWKDNLREVREKNSNSGRRSRSRDYQIKFSPRGSSIDRKVERSVTSSASLSRDFKERSNKSTHFLEKQDGSFTEKSSYRKDEKRNVQKSDSIDNRVLTSEKSLDRRSVLSSTSHTSLKQRDHFLGVGDGPFQENRPICQAEKEMEQDSNKDIMSPISQEGSFEIYENSISRLELSPVSEPESVGKTGFSKTRSDLQLSPISQPGSFEKREFTDDPEVRPYSRMELSPVSQTGSFGDREFSQGIENHPGLSPISQSESLVKGGFDQCTKNSGIPERPSSADSMQRFLAELEEDDRSRSSSERHHLEDSVQPYKSEPYNKVGDVKDQYNHNLESRNVLSGQKDSLNLNKFDKVTYSNIPKDGYTVQRSFSSSFNYDSKFDNNTEKSYSKGRQPEERFNAYENSFNNIPLDKSYTFHSKNIPSKKDIQLPYLQENRPQNVQFSKGSELNTSSLPPVKYEIASKSQLGLYQNYENNNQQISPFEKPANQFPINQIPSNLSNKFQGNNIRPEVNLLFPSFQTASKKYPLLHRPSILSFIPPPAVQYTPLSNQGVQIPQALERPSGNFLSNPIFSRRTDHTLGQKVANRQDDSGEFVCNPDKSRQSTGFNMHKQNFNQNSFSGPPPRNEKFPITPTMRQNEILSLSSPQIPYFQRSDNNTHSLNQFKEYPPRPIVSGQNMMSQNNIPCVSNMRKDNLHVQHHPLKEVIVISDEEMQSEDDELVFISDGIVFPKATVVEKYKHYPPMFGEMGKILKGFVIYFGVQPSSELQKDPFEVLQESFSKSDGFQKLDFEETKEYDPPCPEPKKVCLLRWKGLLLSRGEANTQAEARHVAALSLINTLAKTCYTIQTKYGYYNNGKLPKFILNTPEKPGYYKLVRRDEIIKAVTDTVKTLKAQGLAGKGVDATHINAVLSYMDEFFRDTNNHCELIFGPSTGMDYTFGELKLISNHAFHSNLQFRWFHGTKKLNISGKFLGVSRVFSPQALKRYLRAENGDTVRYRLYPPQGPLINLLTPDNVYSDNIIKSIAPRAGHPQNKPGQATTSTTKPNLTLPPSGPNQSNQLQSSRNVMDVNQRPIIQGNLLFPIINQHVQIPNQRFQPPNPNQNQNQSFQGLNKNLNPNLNQRFQGPNLNLNQRLQAPSQNPNKRFQAPNQNPNQRYQAPSQPIQYNQPVIHPGFGQQDPQQNISNLFLQGGFKRADPFQGDMGGIKRGRWM